MAEAPQDKDLTALIGRIRGIDGDQTAWRSIRTIFSALVRAAIRKECDDIAGDGSLAEADIERRIEVGFWRRRWQTRRELPASTNLFRAEISRSAGEHAQEVIAEYRAFQQLLVRCKLDLETVLASTSSSPDPLVVAELRDLVREQLWHLRHRLPHDCESFNRFASETARETAQISSLFQRSISGERQAMDELFKIFFPHMAGICRRLFSEIPDHAQQDILQDAVVKLLSGMPRTLDPRRVSTWRGFLRTVVFNAGIDWLRINHRYVNPADLGTEEDG